MSYVEFHAASGFRFLQGAVEPEELAARCAELELPAIAALDRHGVYGAPRLYNAAKALGVKAHVGAEVTGPDGCVYPLLVESRRGYRNLCRLLTRMHQRGPRGAVKATEDELREHAAGLVCLTGDEHGPLAQALPHGAGQACLERLQSIWGRANVYVELQRHLDFAQEERNQAAIELARRLQLPLLATNGACCALPEQRALVDVLACIRHHKTLDNAGQLLARNGERYLKPAARMQALFHDLPEALAETLALSQRLDFTLADLGYEFPAYPVPAGETMDLFLRAQVWRGAAERYRPLHGRARAQLERELGLITKLRLAGYFLAVWDITEFCRKNGILAQGRGSAANSAVCYALGITNVDPVGMELLFERFLSEERAEWPDIDIDLPSGDRREAAIQYVYRTYGARGAAMTANVITYRGPMAAREVGKVLGFDETGIARLSKLARSWEWKDPADTVERKFREAGLDLNDPRVRHYFQLFLQIQGLPRHLGQHSGGMVICRGNLDEIVPLEPAAMPGRVIVQWDKDDCAQLGILKIDLLGLGMMAVLQETCQIIERDYGETVSLAHLPADDPAVYDTLCAADTVGMFQVESRAQMATLPRLRPQRFYDLVVEVAIIRPGPIVGKMVHPYIRRRQGLEEVSYPHPSLEPVLKRTLGLPLFQEQLLKMAMAVANFTGGQAEELRRAFGYKRSERLMVRVERELRKGMTENGIPPDTQEMIVQSITSFALYGFPESHAISFALLSYASAYLKVHYLGAFLCAMLNNQPMGFYSPASLIKDAQRHGLRVLPVDVQISDYLCTIEQRDGERCLRLGLNYVRGLRQQTAQEIAAGRPYTNVEELARRVRLQAAELTRLAAVGALNQLAGAGRFEAHRRDALWQADAASRPVGPLLNGLVTPPAPSPLRPMTTDERLRADYNGTGVNIGAHPMAHYRPRLRDPQLVRAADLPYYNNGRKVAVAGVVIVRQRPQTAHGFVFMSVEDETGIANVIITPKLFDAQRTVWTAPSFVRIEGIVQTEQGVTNLRASGVRMLFPQAEEFKVPSHDFH